MTEVNSTAHARSSNPAPSTEAFSDPATLAVELRDELATLAARVHQRGDGDARLKQELSAVSFLAHRLAQRVGPSLPNGFASQRLAQQPEADGARERLAFRMDFDAWDSQLGHLRQLAALSGVLQGAFSDGAGPDADHAFEVAAIAAVVAQKALDAHCEAWAHGGEA